MHHKFYNSDPFQTLQSSIKRAYAPKFPKPRDENWFLVLGSDDELVAMKRVPSVKSQSKQMINFTTPDVPGGYIGLISEWKT